MKWITFIVYICDITSDTCEQKRDVHCVIVTP